MSVLVFLFIMSNLESRRQMCLEQTITKPINGDEAALKLLNVSDWTRINFKPSRAITKKSLTADYTTYTIRMLACAKVGNFSLEQACKRMLTYLANNCQMHFNEEILALASIITREKMLEEMLHLAGEVPFLPAVSDAGSVRFLAVATTDPTFRGMLMCTLTGARWPKKTHKE